LTTVLNAALQIQEFEQRSRALEGVNHRCILAPLAFTITLGVDRQGESTMRISISCAFAFTMIVAASSADAGGPGANGKWAGEMRQIDPKQESSYPMTLTLQGAKGQSAYPTLKCGGAWTKVAQKDGYAIYKETVRNDADGTCVDGLMTVAEDAGRLLVGWFGVYEGEPSVATAVLRREAK
jgi:hypothetical protein